MCVRPDHCRLGGPVGVQNNRGERNPSAKLDYAKATEIRARFAAGESGSALGVEYGVTATAICRVVNGRTWA